MRRQKSRVSGKRFLFIWSAIDVKKYEVLALKASFTRGELGFDSLSKGSSQILLEQTSHPCGSRTVVSSGVGTPGIAIQACEKEFRSRGRRFEKQLTVLKRIWSGESPKDHVGPIGPLPVQKGGPELLIGGYNPRAIERIGKFADGYISGSSGDPSTVVSVYKLVLESWKKNNRSGRPRLVSSIYFALGESSIERGSVYLKDYYGAFAEHLISRGGLLSNREKLKESLMAFSKAGVDELMLWPTIPEMEQLELLADAVPQEYLV
jgi:alkanesulfonate monooxygenase SsuD/methylene tetrahydromethanopterin reductase-like flavin-dependent oxidoreductase (luciferase family)